ncbi:glycosyltransferase [Lactiplantibacillus plantarum]|uniref:glycosyltransferase n=1 Tax=Lactiplantibacillus plantarum TaxID=1590 RepID=UPI002657D947|nr:glycosyltransferase [Lactiplantibacillus plantarum]
MEKFIDTARIVITHGGPSSFINVLSKGKNPIVVPRLSRFDEHVNDHQLTFVRELQKRKFNIIVVEDMQLLEEAIVNFTNTSNTFNSNKDAFVERFSHIVYELF